jgi:glycosyltransferase involved in cell wall biosynthesis
MQAALGEHYRVCATRMLVIPNGTPLGDRTARKENLVLAAGRMWDPAKNLEALTAAAKAISGGVMIAGDAGSSSNRQACEHVQMLGRLPAGELARLRRHAAVFAAPARYEPFGLAILEAAADHCALVLGDISSLRESWDGCALFIEPEDHEALASAINSLLWHPERASALGRRARRRAEELSITRTARSYAVLYHELVRTRALSAV